MLNARGSQVHGQPASPRPTGEMGQEEAHVDGHGVGAGPHVGAGTHRKAYSVEEWRSLLAVRSSSLAHSARSLSSLTGLMRALGSLCSLALSTYSANSCSRLAHSARLAHLGLLTRLTCALVWLCSLALSPPSLSSTQSLGSSQPSQPSERATRDLALLTRLARPRSRPGVLACVRALAWVCAGVISECDVGASARKQGVLLIKWHVQSCRAHENSVRSQMHT